MPPEHGLAALKEKHISTKNNTHLPQKGQPLSQKKATKTWLLVAFETTSESVVNNNCTTHKCQDSLGLKTPPPNQRIIYKSVDFFYNVFYYFFI